MLSIYFKYQWQGRFCLISHIEVFKYIGIDKFLKKTTSKHHENVSPHTVS